MTLTSVNQEPNLFQKVQTLHFFLWSEPHFFWWRYAAIPFSECRVFLSTETPEIVFSNGMLRMIQQCCILFPFFAGGSAAKGLQIKPPVLVEGEVAEVDVEKAGNIEWHVSDEQVFTHVAHVYLGVSVCIMVVH